MKKILCGVVIALFFLSSCGTSVSHQETAKTGNNGKQEKSSKKIFTQVDSIMQLGNKISKDLLQSLQKELKKNLQEGGAVAAIQMCNTQALPLTRKIEDKYHVRIKRISQLYRNPKNKPDSYEDQLLATVDYHYGATKEIKAFTNFRTLDGEDYVIYYKPLLVKGVCLKCHGDVNEMDGKVVTKLKELYPEDLAVNYHEKDFRGLLSIAFKIQEENK